MNNKNLILINKNNYEYKFKPVIIKNNINSPLIEFKRYKFLRFLANELKNYLYKNNIKISFNDCFSLSLKFINDNNNFDNKKERLDPLFPFNGKIYEALIESFLTILNKNNSAKNKKDENIFIDFPFSVKCDEFIKQLEVLKKNNSFKKENDNFVYKSELKGVNQIIYIHYNGNNKELGNNSDFVKMTYKIHSFLYSKLKNQYKIYCNLNKIKYEDNDFIKLLLCLLIRYETINAGNEQLACNPEFYYEMKKKYNYDFELFGSALNTQYHQFCSIFYDIEKYFLSRGSFFDLKCIEGNYVANPPFINSVIEKMAIKLIKDLDDNNNSKPLSFFITIPGWTSNEEYGEYTGFEIMKRSKYFTYFKEIPKEEARFFNYYKNKIVYPCKIFFLILENEKSKEEYKIKENIDNLIKKYFHKPKGNEFKYVPKSIIYKYKNLDKIKKYRLL